MAPYSWAGTHRAANSGRQRDRTPGCGVLRPRWSHELAQCLGRYLQDIECSIYSRNEPPHLFPIRLIRRARWYRDLSAAPLLAAQPGKKYKTALIGSGWWGMN